MSVDSKEVNEMARLINLMNSNVQFEDEPVSNINEGLTRTVSQDHVDPNVSEMKRILEAFNNIQNSPTKRLTDRAFVNKELREALITQETDNGVRIGNWDIVVKESARKLKTYDVVSVQTGIAIAIDLTIYEAAHGITQALNEGKGINSRQVKDILQAEGEYAHHRQDAAIFKQKLAVIEHDNNEQRVAIMEDRFSESLRRAQSARQKVMKLTNN